MNRTASLSSALVSGLNVAEGEAFKTGWRRWCRMGLVEDCATDAERAGFAYAARENELGGNRPSVREAADALADFLRLGAR